MTQEAKGQGAGVDSAEQDLTAPEAHRDTAGNHQAVFLLRLALILVVVLTVAESQEAVTFLLLMASPDTLRLVTGADKKLALAIDLLGIFLVHTPLIVSAVAALVGLYRMWSWGRWMAAGAGALAVANAIPATMRIVSLPYDVGPVVWAIAARESMSVVTALLWAAILVMIFRPPLAQMFR